MPGDLEMQISQQMLSLRQAILLLEGERQYSLVARLPASETLRKEVRRLLAIQEPLELANSLKYP